MTTRPAAYHRTADVTGSWFSEIILGAMVALCGYCLVLQAGYAWYAQLLLLALLAATIALRTPFGIYLFVVLVLGYPLVQNRFGRGVSLSVIDLPYAIALVGLLVCSFRLLELRRLASAASAPADTRWPAQSKQTTSFWLRIGQALLVMSTLLAAWMLMWMFPLDFTTPRRLGLVPSAARALSMAWFLIFVWLVIRTFLSFLWWWRWEPAQADIYVRSALVGELDRDLSAIERRRARGIKLSKKRG